MIVAHELGTLGVSRMSPAMARRLQGYSPPQKITPPSRGMRTKRPTTGGPVKVWKGTVPRGGKITPPLRFQIGVPGGKMPAGGIISKEMQDALMRKQYATAYGKSVVPNYTVAGPTALTSIEKKLQQIILRRDYDTLFDLIPLSEWKAHWMLGKYSFRGDGAARRYVPFTRADIRKFVFSKYYTVAAGYTCTDAQRELGVNAHWKAQSRHQQKFGPNDWRSNWPIYPGGGYGDQTRGCQHEVKSSWVKFRDKAKPIAIVALAVTGGIFLGKALIAKAAASKAATAAAAGKAGIVGAGTKAGAAVAVTTKAGAAGALATKAGTVAALKTGAGTAAAVAAAAGGVSTGATTAGGIVGAAAKAAPVAENIINSARTVKAVADGELPPPPISLGDGSLTDYATVVAKQLAERELQQKLSQQENEMLRQMIESERRYLAAGETPHRPVVNTGLNPVLTAAQRTRADAAVSEGGLIKMLALGVPALLLLMNR